MWNQISQNYRLIMSFFKLPLLKTLTLRLMLHILTNVQLAQDSTIKLT